MALVRSEAAILFSFSLLFFLISIQASPLPEPNSGRRGAVVGGRREIVDVRGNEEVQELGRFSVGEYNRRRRIASILRRGGGEIGGELRFVEVVEAERQVVSGIKYYMKVAAEAAAENGGERRTFESVVVVQPWLKLKRLVGFSPVNERGYRS